MLFMILISPVFWYFVLTVVVITAVLYDAEHEG